MSRRFDIRRARLLCEPSKEVAMKIKSNVKAGTGKRQH
jgi:hypothetical protein